MLGDNASAWTRSGVCVCRFSGGLRAAQQGPAPLALRSAERRNLPQLFQLPAGDGCPRAGGVNFQVALPMPRRPQKVTRLFVKKRHVVMSVTVIRVQLERGGVLLESPVELALLVV